MPLDGGRLWDAHRAGHTWTELLVPGLLIMADGGTGILLDYQELERSHRPTSTAILIGSV
jgi:hypothetical protein